MFACPVSPSTTSHQAATSETRRSASCSGVSLIGRPRSSLSRAFTASGSSS
jgi:hypothetical protein